ncbi:ABC transporter ATP-binding protein [Halanaerobium salsuginis]|uniref:Iron complex transport system ATP-binding protein n=1 Tax=Halanaerobium salsuginis TaxID=29563 RepID=A0A1I4IXK2_9FIRM|nr:ABC transporter ATP-binding protein [Halanaerobium salsuginis]SFL59088.1 iron complex transport system ATP-binding protein [Halanaerobium salsuginis]
MLKLNNVNFNYGKSEILKNINLELSKGQLLTLVGPNGSGKSTLLKCINNFLDINSGTIMINGKNLDQYKRQELARLIAYVPQQISSPFPNTVFDTILMGRKVYQSWRPSHQDRKLTAKIINKLGLAEIAFTKINQLSGGQRQKVYLGRGLAQQAKLILLDEPNNNLDLKHQLEIFNLIKREVNQGSAAVIIMHDLSLASRFSDKIVMLKSGQVFKSGRQEILTAANIYAVYGVKVSLKDHQGFKIVIPEKIAN